MNILRLFARRKNQPFTPQENVRFATMAIVHFETPRDEKRFQRAALGHMSEAATANVTESEKFQTFNLLVNGERMTGRIFRKRHEPAAVGNGWISMFVECQPRGSKKTPVVHVSIRFAQTSEPLPTRT